MLSAAFRCPACAAPAGSHDISCDTCGLIFSSYVPGVSPPGALAAAACPACARPVGAGERICPACMTALPLGLKALRLGQPLAAGRYTVRQALRRGGMGAIYLAIDHGMFDRVVVVKALLDYFDPADQQAAQERFLHEARTLAELRHPAIPRIYGYFQDHGRNYIVMEHVEGADLDQGLTHIEHDTGMTIAGRAYEQEDVLLWGAAICRVLEYLAACQPHPIVHHDIKPANLLLDRHSQAIRLVDFGTARGRPATHAGAGLGRSSIFGTPGYAAPEQYRGQSEPRSDVYALAATLYHLATDDDPCAHPFTFPRLAQLGSLGDILQDALNPDLAQRSTATDLRRRLETVLAPLEAPALEAPDGIALRDLPALARWCETNWSQVYAWLRSGDLPNQVERRWGKTRLAAEMRALPRVLDFNDTVVDRLIVLLDPHGFGAAAPRLAVDRPVVEFGPVDRRAGASCTLTLRNIGRRYAKGALEMPDWLRADRETIRLAPGCDLPIMLHASLRGFWIGGKIRGSVRICVGSEARPYRGMRETLLEVPVRASGSFWRALLRQFMGGAQ